MSPGHGGVGVFAGICQPQRVAGCEEEPERYSMGFALWVDGETAWAQGTHEYRPMGAAVIGVQGVFTPRDFRDTRRAPHRYDPRFAGHFASLGEMNDWLRRRPSKRGQRGGREVAQILG
jgi:hypothetical protein